MMMINIKKDAFALRTFSHFQLSTFNYIFKIIFNI